MNYAMSVTESAGDFLLRQIHYLKSICRSRVAGGSRSLQFELGLMNANLRKQTPPDTFHLRQRELALEAHIEHRP